MNTMLPIGTLLALTLSFGCHRIADEDPEPPEWLFDVYSNHVVGGSYDGPVTRFRFFDDHRVLVERDFDCSPDVRVSWELVWSATGPNSISMKSPEGAPPHPDAIVIEEWFLEYSSECEPLELGFVRVSTGDRTPNGQLHRGEVCGYPVEPPEDWGGGEWDECDWNWCEAEPVDMCE